MARSRSVSGPHPDKGVTPLRSAMAFGLRLAVIVMISAARLGHLAEHIPGRRLDSSTEATA